MSRISCATALLLATVCFCGCASKAPQAAADAEGATDKVAPPGAIADAAQPRAGLVEGELIDRKKLFGNPDKTSARISPDGSKLSYLAPRDGVLNVWVGPLDDPDAAKPVTDDKNRGIRAYFWAYDNKHILYIQDNDGDEDWHVYSVDLDNGETKDLTPLEKIAAQIEGVSEKFPDEILVGLNDRDPQLPRHLSRQHRHRRTQAGAEESPTSPASSPTTISASASPSKLTARRRQPIVRARRPGRLEGVSARSPFEDTLTTAPAGFDKTGDDPVPDRQPRPQHRRAGRDRPRDNGKQKVLAANDQADVGGVLAHPTEKNIQAVSFTYERPNGRFSTRRSRPISSI